MCKECLERELERYERYIVKLNKDKEGVKGCECCTQFIEFLAGMYKDFKILNLTKIKLLEQCCFRGYNYISRFYKMIQERITNKLTNYMEELFDNKEDMPSGKYVDRMNLLKNLKDHIEAIENLME